MPSASEAAGTVSARLGFGTMPHARLLRGQRLAFEGGVGGNGGAHGLCLCLSSAADAHPLEAGQGQMHSLAIFWRRSQHQEFML
jgi:hypothetical protein